LRQQQREVLEHPGFAGVAAVARVAVVAGVAGEMGGKERNASAYSLTGNRQACRHTHTHADLKTHRWT